jgi:hypothetical protein
MKTLNQLEKKFTAEAQFSNIYSLEAQIPDKYIENTDILEETKQWIKENIDEEYWPSDL